MTLVRTILGGPVGCPQCSFRFEGSWLLGEDETIEAEKEQQCPSCGHVFPAAWPWTPRTETIIVRNYPDGSV